MANNGQDMIKKILIVVMFIILLIVTFLVVQPFLSSILFAIVLAYVLRPFYKKIDSKLKSPNVSSFIVCIIVLLVSMLLVFFIAKVAIDELVHFYSFTQTQDLLAPIKVLFGNIGFPAQISVLFDQAVAKGTSSVMNYLAATIMDLPLLALQFFVLFFVLFYFMRDAAILAEYFKNIMPFRAKVREQFFHRFRKITNSVIFGNFLVGAIDGVLVGIGLYLFKVPNAFILTFLAIILGVLPIVGPGMVWVPSAIFMLGTGNIANALGLSLFCGITTGIASRIFMTNIIGKRASMANGIALVGMLGGLKLFGIIGLIIGPLVLDYFTLFIEFYKKGEVRRLI